MSDLRDTSMIVRCLTGDPPDLSDVSAEVMDGIDTLLDTDLVIVKTADVLISEYEVPRAAVVDGLIALLGKANFDTFLLYEDLVLEALLSFRPSGRVLIADALVLVAHGQRQTQLFTRWMSGSLMTKSRCCGGLAAARLWQSASVVVG